MTAPDSPASLEETNMQLGRLREMNVVRAL